MKDSTKALSVGLPGREKSSVTLFSYAHRSSAFEMNSGPLSTRMVLGAPRIDEIRAITSTDSFMKFIQQERSQPSQLGAPEFTKLVRDEIAQWKRGAAERGIKPE